MNILRAIPVYTIEATAGEFIVVGGGQRNRTKGNRYVHYGTRRRRYVSLIRPPPHRPSKSQRVPLVSPRHRTPVCSVAASAAVNAVYCPGRHVTGFRTRHWFEGDPTRSLTVTPRKPAGRLRQRNDGGAATKTTTVSVLWSRTRLYYYIFYFFIIFSLMVVVDGRLLSSTVEARHPTV